MTKTQIWLGGFVLVFIALFVLGRITKKEDAGDEMVKAKMSQQAPQEASAEQLITKLNCANCHGRDLSGSGMAPTLTDLKKDWKRDDLINYLRNPSSYMTTDKFKMYKDKYRNVVMPSYGNVDVKDLGKNCGLSFESEIT